MQTRAFSIGFNHGRINEEQNNYIRNSKRKEYETGFGEGTKVFMSKVIKNKPQLFHNGSTRNDKKRITLSIKGGVIQDIVRENMECEIIIHDYDIEGIDTESNIHCKKDQDGESYQIIRLE